MLFETLAVTGGTPSASSVGKVISVPEPTTALIMPAPTPAASTASASHGLTGRPYPALGCGSPARPLLVDHGVEVGEPLQAAQRLGHPRVALEARAHAGEEGPVTRREGAGALADADPGVVGAAAAVVAHPVDVGAAAGVRLGRHEAAVRVLGHADDVRQHDPVVAVHEAALEPVGQLRRIVAALQRPVAEHHEPLDVVGPAVLADGAQHVGETVGADLAVRVELGEPARQRLVGTEGVGLPVLLAGVP